MEATPHNRPAPASVPIENTVKAQRTTVDGAEQRQRLRAFRLAKGQTSALEVSFQNEDGNPYDLESLGPEAVFSGSLTESAFGGKPRSMTVTVQENGTLAVTVPDVPAGVYRAEVRLTVDDGLVAQNQFLIYICQTGQNQFTGPPSIEEVRLQMFDSSPDENLLLEDFQFTDEEIALAVMRPIQYFNEVPPRLSYVATTSNFPWRFHWLEGIAGQLLLLAAEKYCRNHLQYQGGGLSVADMDKERSYRAAGMEKWQTFKVFVMQKKAEINLDAFWGSIGSIHRRT